MKDPIEIPFSRHGTLNIFNDFLKIDFKIVDLKIFIKVRFIGILKLIQQIYPTS